MHACSLRRIRLLTLVRQLTLTVCGLALCAADTFAAQPDAGPPILVLPLENFTNVPAKPAAPKQTPPRKKRRKRKAAGKGTRNSNLYYHWSAQQLMSGGVNPPRTGKTAAGASSKPATGKAARSRQKPRALHHNTA